MQNMQCGTLSRSMKTSFKQIHTLNWMAELHKRYETRSSVIKLRESCRCVASKGNNFDFLRQILAYSLRDGPTVVSFDQMRVSRRQWVHYCIIYTKVFANPCFFNVELEDNFEANWKAHWKICVFLLKNMPVKIFC